MWVPIFIGLPCTYSDNNKSQGNVATHLRCGGLALIKNYRSERIFKIGTYLAKLQAKWFVSHALFEVHCPA